LQRGDRRLEIEVTGPLVADDAAIIVAAAVAGLGVAYLFESDPATPLARGDLVTLFDDWTPAFAGYQIYFPSRRGVSPVLRAFLDFIGKPRGVAWPDRNRRAPDSHPGLRVNIRFRNPWSTARTRGL
jgi:DNA-binding transcriptional LysR family regulator